MRKEEELQWKNRKKQQLEALELGCGYIAKLIPAMKEIIPELRGAEMPDTEDYLNQQLDGLNYVINIINITIPFLNEKEKVLNKDAMEEKVQNLNRALGNNSHAMIANAFEADILPMLDIYRQIALVVLERENNEQ